MISSKLIKNALYLNKFDENFRSVLKQHNIEMHSSMFQTHSDIVKMVKTNGEFESDSLITGQKKHALVVKTADCMPILLDDDKFVGAVHSGWRGIENGIFEKSLKNFDHKKLKVSIGPHAQSCCYEVQSDLYEKFGEFVKVKDSKYYLQLSKKIKDLSKKYSFKLEVSKICTICEKDYFSYRENGTSERQFSLIWR
jgi:YfiH family protein